MDYTKGLDECVGRLQRRLEVGISAFHLLGTETEVGGGGEGCFAVSSWRKAGQGYSTKCYARRLCPEIQPFTFLCSFLTRKGTPFIYFYWTNGSHIPN